MVYCNINLYQLFGIFFQVFRNEVVRTELRFFFTAFFKRNARIAIFAQVFQGNVMSNMCGVVIISKRKTYGKPNQRHECDGTNKTPERMIHIGCHGR